MAGMIMIELFLFNVLILPGVKQQIILKNITMLSMANNCKTMIGLLAICVLVGCSQEKDLTVKCQLFSVTDSYPENTEYADDYKTRMISFNYYIINDTQEECFLPITNRSIINDTTCCSRLNLYIGENQVEGFFSADTRWDGYLKPLDSIRVKLIITEPILKKANVSKQINLSKLMEMIRIDYQRCPSDSLLSQMPIPNVRFTKNDSINFSYGRNGGSNVCY